MLGITVNSSSSQPSASIVSIERRRKSIPSRSISRDDISPGILFRVADAVTLICNSGITSRNGIEQERIEEWDWKVGSTEKRMVKSRLRSFSLTERMEPHLETESDGDLVTYPNFIKRRASISSPAITVHTGPLTHLVPNQFLQTTSRRVSTHGTAPGCACSSCGSTVTPYWRDGWAADVMLCNACGLRFQKFARRCPACMYIPRKEDSLGDRCVKCNQFWIVGSN